jgi:hypothetical protein
MLAVNPNARVIDETLLPDLTDIYLPSTAD